jgi:two-component sensor histidine kinase
MNMHPVFVNIDTAIPCSLIINELISNTLKHAFRGRDRGRVDINLQPVTSGKYLLIVSDDGIGLPEGLDVSKTDSLGLRLVNALSTQLRGKVEYRSDNGTQARINFTSADYKERI